jgi:hypothetical protein
MQRPLKTGAVFETLVAPEPDDAGGMALASPTKVVAKIAKQAVRVRILRIKPPKKGELNDTRRDMTDSDGDVA